MDFPCQLERNRLGLRMAALTAAPLRGAKQKSREMQKILQLMQQYEVLGMEETHELWSILMVNNH